jgi:malonate transporter MadL subunit
MGIAFWAMMYIPVVVAMAATQNVLVAVKGGPIALLAAAGTLFVATNVIPTRASVCRARSVSRCQT